MLLDMSFYLIVCLPSPCLCQLTFHSLSLSPLQVTVVLLNIFFGIIIDTFGKLRNLKVEREAETANKCFICGVDAHDFVKDGSSSGTLSFKQHREERHNLWNYLSFAMHLWHQPREKDSSVEMTVRACMELGDVSWFPIGHYETNSRGGPGGAAAGMVKEGAGEDMRHFSLARQSSNGSVASHTGAGQYLTTDPSSLDREVASASDRLLRAEFDRLTDIMTEKLKSLEDALSSLTTAQQTLPQQLTTPAPSPQLVPILNLQPLRRLQSLNRPSDPTSPLSPPSSPLLTPQLSSQTQEDEKG
jgi:hypothetical protein